MRRRIHHKRIPEALGNGVCGVKPYVMTFVLNFFLHLLLFFLYGRSPRIVPRLAVSFIFFIYPFYYITDVIWSLQPAVCLILSGKTLINRKFYMNVPRKEVKRSELMPVTVSIPVYTEENAVIFNTIEDSLAAVKRYRSYSGQQADVLVSDDGLAILLGGGFSSEAIDRLAFIDAEALAELTEPEKKAAERIRFYRKHAVPFVARPAAGRTGLFKKASNLNYTIRLGEAIASGEAAGDLLTEGGPFQGGYAEGSVVTREIILLLDKDSGVREQIIEAIMPEFAGDEKLAYVQCATNSRNLYDNYFSYAVGHQINNLFHCIWPCKALQGFFVPLVGHNVFIRKSHLIKSGLWSENKVSEDYDKALSFYNMGFHGKYAQIRGLEFTEYVSRAFVEETGKQHRYAYGLFEMMFDGSIVPGKSRGCDVFYMFLYFLSTVNAVMLIPTILYECYFGNIHYLWAGFLVCNAFFVLSPVLRGIVMLRYRPGETSENGLHAVIIAVSFVGHSMAMLSAAVRYLVNKVWPVRRAFPSTTVDTLQYRFFDGIRLFLRFLRHNPWFVPIAFLCLDRAVFIITRKRIDIPTVVTYCYVLLGVVLAPILMTPQLFGRPRRQGAYSGLADSAPQGKERESVHMLTPKIVETENAERASAADVEAFLSSYSASLESALAVEGMPEEILSGYSFESCIRKDEERKKEVYLTRRREDGLRAILKVTAGSPEENALEEAELLKRLHHPGIPRTYETFVKDGKYYHIREYIEGRSLYETVKTNGRMSADDIFNTVLKLTDILTYLHSRTPPVIHRDIKPQNIIVSTDGTVHLIDFGIARVHKEERSQDTAVVLTMDYAPPEQYGFEQTSPLTDIYSLGVVMLFMATGRVARSGLEAQIVNNKLRNLIERCIAFDPKLRVQSAEEIQALLPGDDRRHRARRRLAVAVSSAAAAFLLLLTAWYAGTELGTRQGLELGRKNGYDSGYVDAYDAVPAFSAGTVALAEGDGNFPGNMAVPGGAYAVQGEDALFCIIDGDIYQMSANGAQLERIAEAGDAKALSYYRGWLYYSVAAGIRQTNIYTQKSELLWSEPGAVLCIRDHVFYILADGSAERLHVPGGSTEKLPADFADTLLTAQPLSEETQSNLDSVHAAAVHSADGGLYYLDGFDGSVWSCSPDGKIRQRILSNSASDFNLAGGWIFYHNTDDGGRLWCIRLDGTNDHRL